MSRPVFTEEQLRSAVIEYAEALYASDPERVPEHIFSERYETRKRQIIEMARELGSKRRRRAVLRKTLRSAAAAAIVVIISFALVMTFSQTVRAAVLNWFVETYNKIIYFRFDHEEDGKGVIICEPGDLPEGFVRTSAERSGSHAVKTYKDPETGEYIIFEYYRPSEDQIREAQKPADASETYLIFDYYEAYYTESGRCRQLRWYDPDRDLVFCAGSDINDKEAFINAFKEIDLRLPHYEPDWIPEGYEEYERSDDYPSFCIHYSDKEGRRPIYYYVYDMAESDMIFVQKGVGEETDDAVYEKIQIGSMPAYYCPPTEHDGGAELIIIDEKDHFIYCITADLSEEELIRMAESIKCSETSW